MFTDYFLKFTDEAEAKTAIGTHDITNEEGTVIESNLHRDSCAISVIGTMYTETGVMLTDDEGNQYPETTALDGYHVNLRARSPQADLDAYNTNPATPQRVWA